MTKPKLLEIIRPQLRDAVSKRGIRSFNLREGRMTPGQAAAFEQQWPHWGLSLDDGLLTTNKVFGQTSDTVLEIGFGMGGSLVEMAKAASDTNFIGIEVYRGGIGSLMRQMLSADVDNIRVYCADAVAVLDQCIADDSLHRVQIYFPDPWRKKKHFKRRIIQPEFVQVLRKKLKPGAELHLATDWQNYAEHMVEVMQSAPGYQNLAKAGVYSPRPDFRPQTKFELRGKKLGHVIRDLRYIKVPNE